MATLVTVSTDPSTSIAKKFNEPIQHESKDEETPSAPPSLEALNIEEPKNEEESDSDSDDEMFAGMSPEDIAKIKAKMGVIQSAYEENQNAEKKRAIIQTKKEIEFNLAISVNDEEADFIAQFVKNEQISLSDRLQEDGVLFL